MKPLILYLLLINALGFTLMLTDKDKARKKLPRISEATLLGIAVIGGSMGSLMGMYLIRHKTKRPKFAFGLPILTTVHIFAILLLKLFLIR